MIFTEKEKKTLALGIDLGTHAIRYVLIDKKQKQIIDWDCFLVDESDRYSSLKKISKLIPKQKLGSITLSLQASQVMIGRFKIPYVGKLDREQRIEMALSNDVQVPQEELTYYYHELEGLQLEDWDATNLQPEKKDKGKLIYHYAACRKTVIQRMSDEIQNLFGIVPDITTQGYAHEELAQHYCAQETEGAVALINAGRSVTNISIFKNGRLLFEREISLAGQDVTRSIFISYLKGATEADDKSLEYAEQLKKEIGIPNQTMLIDEKEKKLYRSVEVVLDAWVQDIQLTFSFFKENFGGIDISKIYVMGGMINQKNILPYLKNRLYCDVHVVQFQDQMEIAPTGFHQKEEHFTHLFHEYASVLSLALKPSGNGDLTPRECRIGIFEKVGVPALRVASVLFAAMWLTGFAFLQVQSFHFKDTKQLLQDYRQFLSKIEAPYNEMMRWKNFIISSDGTVPYGSTVLRVITRKAPENMLLVKLNIDRENQALLLEGLIFGDPKVRAIAISEFTRDLKKDKHFNSVEMTSLVPEGDGLSKERFEMSVKFRSLGGAK